MTMHHPFAATRRALRAFVLACAGVAPMCGAVAAPPPSVQAFFGPNSLTHPQLSPSGKYIAVLANTPATSHRLLLVLDANDLHKLNVAASFGDGDIVNVHWVNDDRLVFEAGDELESAFLSVHGGLFAVDHDGQNMRTLVSLRDSDVTGTRIKSRVLEWNHWFERTLRDGSDDVVITKGTFDKEELVSLTPLLLDTRTGVARQLVKGSSPDNAIDWAIDDHGHALAAMADSGDKRALVVPDGDRWKTLVEFNRYGISEKGVDLLDVGPDGTVYVSAGEASQAQTTALYKLDLQTGRPAGQALVSLKGFDFEGTLLPDLKKRQIVGIRYFSDAHGTIWYTPDMKALQAEIDAKLPATVNDLEPAECGCSSKVLVTASSDHQPAAFFVYDTQAKTLSGFGGVRPDIDARTMADTDFFRFSARDGLEIPVYVTKPAGKGPFPGVVLVHGGPYLRGRHWAYDSEAQFLASRGYAVIEPEFRGSTGYGARLTRAGFKQWGLAMDDDIVDAARWAVSKGMADPHRMCVMGGSYGGYATLMALIKDPETFRCGVAMSAVTDIPLMYDLQWSDMGADWRGYGMPEMVGDRVKDAAQFDATSPLKLAARLKQPLLLEHGGVDVRVPIEHAEKMRSAMLAAGKTNLEWVRYSEEAHGLFKPENRYDFYTRVEKFLDAQIGPGSVGK